MAKEYLSINAPQQCCFCLAEPAVPHEVVISKSPNSADDLYALMLPVCRPCRNNTRLRWVVYMGSAIVALALGVFYTYWTDSPGPLIVGVVGAIFAAGVTAPQLRLATPVILNRGPVLFRNAAYGELFVASNAAVMEKLNAARTADPVNRRELPPGAISLLQTGGMVGLWVSIAGAEDPTQLTFGIALLILCGLPIALFGPR